MAENENDKKHDIGEDILRIIEKSVESGISEGMSRIEKQQEDRKRNIYDTRRYNTELLLKNYRNFKMHIDNSVYSSSKVEKLMEEKKKFEIQFDKPMDETYIKSIIKSKTITAMLLEQIDTFLDYYTLKCLSSKREEERRKAKVIKLLYLDNKRRWTFEEVSDELHISTKTVNRDRKTAIKELSALFFGIEGIKIK